jgi:hypothetical protein
MQPVLVVTSPPPAPDEPKLQPILVELTQEQLLKEPVMQ